VAGLVEEVFVAKVIAGGKVTIPRRLRDLLDVQDGDYLRLAITEVIKTTEKPKGKRQLR